MISSYGLGNSSAKGSCTETLSESIALSVTQEAMGSEAAMVQRGVSARFGERSN